MTLQSEIQGAEKRLYLYLKHTLVRLRLSAIAIAALSLGESAFAQGYPRIPVKLESPASTDIALYRARDELLSIVLRTDRVALNKRVGRTFFWDRDHGGMFDKKRSPVRNLAAATNWKSLRTMLSAEQAAPRRVGSADYCLPARVRPQDERQLERVAEKLNTDPFFEWGVVASQNKPARTNASEEAAEIDLLSQEMVRVTDWAFDSPEGQQRWVQVITPSGVKGYLDGRWITTLSPEQLCLRRHKSGEWLISGFVGGGD